MKNFEVEYVKDGKRQKMFVKADNKVSAQNICLLYTSDAADDSPPV